MSRDWLFGVDKRCPDEPEKIIPGSRVVLEKLIRAMSDDNDTTLAIDAARKQTEAAFEVSPPQLVIGASEGNYIVSVWLDDGNMFDLIGDSSATGTVDFTIGGQTAPLERKRLVTVEQVLAASFEFFDTGSVDVKNGKWEKC